MLRILLSLLLLSLLVVGVWAQMPSQGVGMDPHRGTVRANKLQVGTLGFAPRPTITSTTTDLTLGPHAVVLVSTLTNPYRLITVPLAASATVGSYLVLKIDATMGEVRLLPTGTDTLNGVNGFLWTNTPNAGWRLTWLSATGWHAEPVNDVLRAEDLANGTTGVGFLVLQQAPILQAGPLDMALTTAGHIEYQTLTAPTVTSGAADCGTSPVITGTDVLGKVTVGSATNGGKCTVTFTNPWSQAPKCFCQNVSAAQLCRGLAATTTTVQLTGTLVAGNILEFHCSGTF